MGGGLCGCVPKRKKTKTGKMKKKGKTKSPFTMNNMSDPKPRTSIDEQVINDHEHLLSERKPSKEKEELQVPQKVEVPHVQASKLEEAPPLPPKKMSSSSDSSSSSASTVKRRDEESPNQKDAEEFLDLVKESDDSGQRKMDSRSSSREEKDVDAKVEDVTIEIPNLKKEVSTLQQLSSSVEKDAENNELKSRDLSVRVDENKETTNGEKDPISPVSDVSKIPSSKAEIAAELTAGDSEEMENTSEAQPDADEDVVLTNETLEDGKEFGAKIPEEANPQKLSCDVTITGAFQSKTEREKAAANIKSSSLSSTQTDEFVDASNLSDIYLSTESVPDGNSRKDHSLPTENPAETSPPGHKSSLLIGKDQNFGGERDNKHPVVSTNGFDSKTKDDVPKSNEETDGEMTYVIINRDVVSGVIEIDGEGSPDVAVPDSSIESGQFQQKNSTSSISSSQSSSSDEVHSIVEVVKGTAAIDAALSLDKEESQETENASQLLESNREEIEKMETNLKQTTDDEVIKEDSSDADSSYNSINNGKNKIALNADGAENNESVVEQSNRVLITHAEEQEKIINPPADDVAQLRKNAPEHKKEKSPSSSTSSSEAESTSQVNGEDENGATSDVSTASNASESKITAGNIDQEKDVHPESVESRTLPNLVSKHRDDITFWSGWRKMVKLIDLIKARLVTETTVENLEKGLIKEEDVARDLQKYLKGDDPIAGLLLKETGEKMSFYHASKKNLVRRGTVVSLLEAQAATGSIIDPYNGNKMSVEEAEKAGLIDKFLSSVLTRAERAAYGFKSKLFDEPLSLFEAMKRNLVVESHGIRLLEAQIATGGIIDPRANHRLPVEVAYERGLFDERLNKILDDPGDDTKGFFDPNTNENLTYLQLLERCIVDGETSLKFLPLFKKKQKKDYWK